MAARTPPTLIIFSTSVTSDLTGLVGDLRREAAWAPATLVALGDGMAKRERRKLLELGCDGYVAKPADRFLFATELLLRTPRLLSPTGESQVERAPDRAVERAAGGIRRATSSFEPPCRRSSP
jgi:DNA-binding response OmpR family regulator